MNSLSRNPGLAWHAAWHGGFWIAVFAFANVFPLWQAAAVALGRSGANLVPLGALGAALIAAAGWAWSARRRGILRAFPFIAGALLAIASLALTDPAFPAKRIHVAEYLALAVMVRAYLSRLAGGWGLAGLTAALTALYGVHDELIQGLLPDRTFGLRDIAVNILSAIAGAALGHGLGIFGHGTPIARITREDAAKLSAIAVAVVFGIAALLAPLPFYRDLPPPVWIVLPVLVAVPISAAASELAHPGLRASLDALVAVAALAALYPMLPHVAPLVLR